MATTRSPLSRSMANTPLLWNVSKAITLN
jgi:hypothetical protein